MNPALKNFAKDILPPLLWRLVKPSSKYGWKGDFQTWQDALHLSKGYNAENIVEKVKEATLKVKNGEVAYERDSVIFQSIEYSWPLLSFLMWISAKNKGTLKVLDFGGSLGSSYFQNRKFLVDLRVQWSVVEQRAFVECGRRFIMDDTLQFFNSLKECIDKNGVPDVVIISCTLPYLEKPYEFLDEIVHYQFPHLIIDNTPFNFDGKDRITIQTVDPSIYDASYPCWFLDYDSVKARIEKKYLIYAEHKNDPIVSLDRHQVQYQGLLAVLK